MGTFLLKPVQAMAIGRAVAELFPFSTSNEEMVHLTDLGDGSGVVRVELTSPTEKRYVTEDGMVLRELPR
jgi:hypothetical protein